MAINKQWLEAWRARYGDADRALADLQGKDWLEPHEASAILVWKLQRVWPEKHLRAFDRNSPETVRDLTRRAFACPDELGAILILTVLDGVGIPVASALLVAHDASRYTVADSRAWKSLVNNGHLQGITGSWKTCWLPYLAACRKISGDAGIALRNVDRALWAADGSTTLP